MPKQAVFSGTVVQAAMTAIKKARDPEVIRMAQTIVVPWLFNASDRMTGQVIGRSRGTVVRFRKRFRDLCSGLEQQERNWGGRRHAYMSLEEERRFLSRFLDQASHGGILVVSEIKRAFESLVGHKVAKTTIYRMLDRHDWRTIVPRPRHPNSNPEAQEGFKKTPKNGE